MGNVIIDDWAINDNELLEHIIYAQTTRNKKVYTQMIIKEVENNGTYFQNLYNTKLSGYVVVWPWSRPNWYYFDKDNEYNYLYHTSGYFNIENFVKYKHLMSYHNLPDVDDRFKYFGTKQCYTMQEALRYLEHPIIEMLNKLKLHDYASSKMIVSKLEKDQKFRKWVFKYANDINEYLPCAAIRLLLQLYKNNTTPQEYCYLFWYNNYLNKYISDYNYAKKCIDYIKENHIFIMSYIDLLKAEKLLMLDLTLPKNSMPHDFQYWHDYYTNLMKINEGKLIDEKIKINVNNSKYKELKVNNYIIRPAISTQELIEEGNALSHCVGRMGYNKKIAENESFILFVRQEKEIPLYTAEVTKDGNILQFYGEHDSPVDTSIREILEKYIKKCAYLKAC